MKVSFKTVYHPFWNDFEPEKIERNCISYIDENNKTVDLFDKIVDIKIEDEQVTGVIDVDENICEKFKNGRFFPKTYSLWFNRFDELPDFKWVKRFLGIADTVSAWSKDPSTKVGAVIVGDKRQIISQGYNGLPRGVYDSFERYNNRPLKYSMIVHAEMNALLNALYNGSSVNSATLIVHNLPVCNECAKAIIQSGIKYVIMDTAINERWQESWDVTKVMFDEAKVYYDFI